MTVSVRKSITITDTNSDDVTLALTDDGSHYSVIQGNDQLVLSHEMVSAMITQFAELRRDREYMMEQKQQEMRARTSAFPDDK